MKRDEVDGRKLTTVGRVRLIKALTHEIQLIERLQKLRRKDTKRMITLRAQQLDRNIFLPCVVDDAVLIRDNGGAAPKEHIAEVRVQDEREVD